MFQNKEQSKNSRRKTKWSGEKQSILYIIQGKDHKDVHQIQKKYTVKFLTGFRKCKDELNWVEEYNNWNLKNTLEEINSILDVQRNRSVNWKRE